MIERNRELLQGMDVETKLLLSSLYHLPFVDGWLVTNFDNQSAVYNPLPLILIECAISPFWERDKEDFLPSPPSLSLPGLPDAGENDLEDFL